MNELHFQLFLLLAFIFSLSSSIFKNPLMLIFGFVAVFAAFLFKQNIYLIISIFMFVFAAFIYQITSFNSYELLIFYFPFIFLFLIFCLLLITFYRFLFPIFIYGRIIAQDAANGYLVTEVNFDFVSGVKPGKYAVKSKKRYKIGDIIKLKLKSRFLSSPELIILDE